MSSSSHITKFYVGCEIDMYNLHARATLERDDIRDNNLYATSTGRGDRREMKIWG
jgi:hypothetical protein